MLRLGAQSMLQDYDNVSFHSRSDEQLERRN